MKVEVSMTSDPMFEVNHWWAKKPDFAIAALQSQLEAAQAIWPELREYTLAKKKATKAEARALGGHARAATLSPERRSEIARAAGNARWGNRGESVETSEAK